MRHYARNQRADKPATNTSPAPRAMGNPATGGITGAFAELKAAASSSWQGLRDVWNTPRVLLWRDRVQRWQALPYSGAVVLLAGTILTTLLVLGVDRAVPLPDPGVVYLPLIAMLAYYWSWRYGALAGLLQLACMYIFFWPPAGIVKQLVPRSVAELIALPAVTLLILPLSHLPPNLPSHAQHPA